VQHYDLTIEVVPSTQTLIGSCLMRVKVLQPTLSAFRFRLRENFLITGLRLDGRPISFVRESITTVRAEFDRPYMQNEVFELRVDYQGVPVSRGFGSIAFTTRSSGAVIVATLSQPYYAYTWWPAKDENTDKATLTFTLITPRDMFAVANGMLTETADLPNNRRRYRYEHTYPIVPYLVAFAATNYQSWSRTFTYNGRTMPVDFYIYPESNTAANRSSPTPIPSASRRPSRRPIQGWRWTASISGSCRRATACPAARRRCPCACWRRMATSTATAAQTTAICLPCCSRSARKARAPKM
jgi:aminopeptidase N